MMSKQLPNIAFFGGEPLGLPALEALVRANLTPSLVVCNPDRRSGRGLLPTSPPIKTWATAHNIPTFQPESYKNAQILTPLTETSWDLFVVVAYNFILPAWLLALPSRGVINVHPSLLPKLRGASPIRTAILENQPEAVGISIMLMDEKMDHGPILAQTPITPQRWPILGPELDTLLGHEGGALLASTIPLHLEYRITPIEQDHEKATYTKKFNKADAELHLNLKQLPTGAEAVAMLHKIYAFAGLADCYFYDNEVRIKIKSASLSPSGQLTLLRIIPEGKREMDVTQYLASRQ